MSVEVIDRATGKRTTLRLIDHNGCCCLKDIITAYDGWRDFAEIEDYDVYLADTDTIKWWETYIDDHYAVEEEIDNLRNELEAAGVDDIDKIMSRVTYALNDLYDLDMERTVAEGVIDDIRQQYLSDHTGDNTNMIG